MATRSQIENYLDHQPDSVSKNVIIVGVDEVGPLLHISKDPKIRKFIPFVTNRTGNNENRSVPRVSVAPTLLGCFVGYVAAAQDFGYPEQDDGTFEQGWYIYDIPYQFALKPKSKLLYDQRNSDEHWIVTYSPDTTEYIPSKIGKCFYRDVTSIGRSGKKPRKECTLIVEVFVEKLVFSKRFVLTKGYWEIKGPEPSNFVESWKDDGEYAVRELDKAEYQTIKKLTADMLSYQTPLWLKW